MGIRERAIIDTQRITSNKTTGAGVDLTLTSKLHPEITVTVIGLHTRHHLSVSNEGITNNDLNAHASISEQILLEVGYPVRVNNEVRMVGDTLYALDSAGINRKYKIAQTHPDESFGLIRCVLEDCS